MNKYKEVVFEGVFGHRGHQMVHLMVDQHAPLLLGLLHSEHIDHSDWHDRIEATHHRPVLCEQDSLREDPFHCHFSHLHRLFGPSDHVYSAHCSIVQST